MNKELQQAIEKRRTHYAIGKSSPIAKEEIKQIVEHSVKHAPSAFNSQSARAVILFDDQHDRLWEIVRETLRKLVPEDSFPKTSEKIDSFKNGFGTILYFEDHAVIEGLQEQFALYKDNFPIWSQNSTGMLQHIIWTALSDSGLGASLQHYNPLIDEQVRAEWGLPGKWKLTAQMPFGTPLADPGDKEFMPIEDRVRTLE